MGKPSRTILAEKHFDSSKSGYTEEHILLMDGSWMVIYDRQLISVRRKPRNGIPTFKYIKLIYPDRGRAVAMARQLNEEYKTDKFQVIKLEVLMRHLRPEDCLELDMQPATGMNFQRGRGRPKGKTKPKQTNLYKQRIIAVDELPDANLGDLLD